VPCRKRLHRVRVLLVSFPGDDVFQPSSTTTSFVVSKAVASLTALTPARGHADPVVGALGFNGGPTRTHALLTGSPAINTGSNPLGLITDQRGPTFPRVARGAADIGAFELSP
jgi:hypothetical protein